MAVPARAVLKRLEMRSTTLIIIALSILFWACESPTQGQAHDEHAHEESDHAGDHHDEVHLLKRQMDVMDIQLGHFQQLDLRNTVKSNGRLELPPQNRAEVTALIGGRVKSIEVFPGRFVAKGQVLAILEQPEFIDLQRNYLTSYSQFELYKSDLERQLKLAEDSLNSPKVYQTVKASFEKAKAEMEGAKAKLQMLGLSIDELHSRGIQKHLKVLAPIEGFIRNININMGSFVNSQESMFEIVDNEHIHIDLMVYEKDIAKVATGQEVVFSLSSQADSVFHGRIFALGKAFEEGPRAMQVHAEIDNIHGGLLPGMYVDARIVTENKKVNALPEEAIVSQGGLEYIFVQEEGHHHDGGEHHEREGERDEKVFHMVEVSTGARDMGFVEVVPADPVGADEHIIVEGAYYLLAEFLKSQGGVEHHH